MNIAIVDITGKGGPRYNESLCSALGRRNNGKGKVYNVSPDANKVCIDYINLKLLHLMPDKLRQYNSIFKKIFLSLEVIANYFYLAFLLKKYKISVAHIEWLPFTDSISLDYYFLKFVKYVNPSLKLVFTMHNMFPHTMNEGAKSGYVKRIRRLDGIFSMFVTHTETSRQEFHSIYSIPLGKISVNYHGIYVIEGYTPTVAISNKFRLLMYGVQGYYKGADVLMEALKLLPKNYIEKTHTIIMGKTPNTMYEKYSADLEKLNVSWNPNFYEQNELLDAFNNSDIVLLPYRSISQSAVLLETLCLRKLILTSNLPSFVETLEGFSEDMFFKCGNPDSLAYVIRNYIDGKIDVEKEMKVIDYLNEKYSWDTSAAQALSTYDKIL